MMLPNLSTSANTLIPDQPITSSSQDRLGRLSIARAIAGQLCAYSDPDSLVIGINGPWGSGKSSLLNLIAEQLALTDVSGQNEPIVVRFDPWNFASIEQLISMFFQSFWKAIGKDGSSRSRKRVKVGLEALSLVLSAGRLSPVGGTYFGEASNILSKLKGAIKTPEQKSPEEIKNQVDGALDDIGRRVIIFIDDIDRLEKDAIQLIFRLIRLNASFRHTTYVLAFDRVPVESALSNNSSEGVGRAYLEKIIQVTFDLPSTEPARLGKIFTEELDKVIAPVPESEWDSDRWSEMYLGSMRHFFRNQRDIIRYVNGLKLALPLVIGEIDTVDFVGLEALRTFAPSTYAFIRDNLDLFVGTTSAGYDKDVPAIKESLAGC